LNVADDGALLIAARGQECRDSNAKWFAPFARDLLLVLDGEHFT